MVDPPQPPATEAGDGDPPAAFVPEAEAANNHVADTGHPQIDHGGGVEAARGSGRGVAAARGGRGGRGVAAARVNVSGPATGR